jgi:endonuclease G
MRTPLLLLLGWLLTILTACGPAPPTARIENPAAPRDDTSPTADRGDHRAGSPHLVMGNPSKAKHDPDDPNNYLMVKDQFALSYNDKKGTPNWVSYRLRKSDFGNTRRPSSFYPDEHLPRSFHHVKPLDYQFSKTGFSRGHLCPNNHRSDSPEDAAATFVMTNMVPQTMELNDGAWKDFEIYCANLARKHNKELYIICGPHGVGGTSEKGVFKTIGNGHIVVPKECWKVVLVLDGDDAKNPLERVNRHSRMHAAVMPNDQSPAGKKWRDYAVSVDAVERLTGYRFFDRAPADIINTLKAKNED